MLTQDDFDALEQLFVKHISKIEDRLTSLEEKVERLETRITALEEKVERLEVRVTALEEKVERLEVRVTSVENRVTSVESRLSLVEDKLIHIEIELLENNVLPRLITIESCYTSTYRRYVTGINQLDAMQIDIDMMKKTITRHSELLQFLA